MRESEFAAMLERFALSPEGYRKVRKGVQKRIVRHMQELRCPSMKAYLERLDTDGAAEREARRLMDVSISRFFRDGPLWRILEEEILPSLIADHPGGLRVWSAGCALGQEALQLPDPLGPPCRKDRCHAPPRDLGHGCESRLPGAGYRRHLSRRGPCPGPRRGEGPFLPACRAGEHPCRR